MLLIQVSLCYILKHLVDRTALSVHIYYTFSHFQTAQKNSVYAWFENLNDVTLV